MRVFLFCLLLAATLLFQSSFISALPEPLFLIPMHLLLGIAVLHRGGMFWGSFWFLACWPIFMLLDTPIGIGWTYIILAGLGPFLVYRIFATRSLFALFGLGITLSVTYYISNDFFRWILDISGPSGGVLHAFPFVAFSIFFLLYTFFLIGIFTEYTLKRLIFIRKPS